MKADFLNLLLFIFITSTYAYKEDLELSEKFTEKYKNIITQTKTGKNFYERFSKIRNQKFPKIYIRNSNLQGFGWYELGEDTIYLNTKYLSMFLNIKNYNNLKIIKLLNSQDKLLNEVVFYTDTLYLHELIHCLQDTLYGKSRYMEENGLYLEFEYEAFFISDMYFHEKMMKNKKIFIKALSGEYSNLYLNYCLDGYLMISKDLNEYKKNIEKRYRKEIFRYVSLSEEEKRKKEKLKEEKIISYATGKKEIYKQEEKDYYQLEKQKKDYQNFLDNFYKIYWTKFSKEALSFIQESALKAKNYPVALDTINYLEIKDENYKKKSALIILSAIDYIKDHKNDMPYDILAQHIKSLENACQKTQRPFPDELNELRKNVYLKTIKKYLKILSKEKDEYAIEYYKENIDFFTQSLARNYGFETGVEEKTEKSSR